MTLSSEIHVCRFAVFPGMLAGGTLWWRLGPYDNVAAFSAFSFDRLVFGEQYTKYVAACQMLFSLGRTGRSEPNAACRKVLRSHPKLYIFIFNAHSRILPSATLLPCCRVGLPACLTCLRQAGARQAAGREGAAFCLDWPPTSYLPSFRRGMRASGDQEGSDEIPHPVYSRGYPVIWHSSI